MVAVLNAEAFHDWLDDMIDECNAPQEIPYEVVRQRVLAAVLISVDVAGHA